MNRTKVSFSHSQQASEEPDPQRPEEDAVRQHLSEVGPPAGKPAPKFHRGR